MSIDWLHSALGWPIRGEITSPTGAGPKIIADSVANKLGNALHRRPDATDAVIGTVFFDPLGDETETPVAIVAEFPRHVSNETLQECHRLAWNMCKSPILLTLEPSIMRVWSCYEPPSIAGSNRSPEIADLSVSIGNSIFWSAIDHELLWENLVSGQFFVTRKKSFNAEHRADRTLLENLQVVRERLLSEGLSHDTSHDLLARVIFIQFLFDRKDSSGNSALNPERLTTLHTEGVLKKRHINLASIFGSHGETYKLFRWLNEKFNGDLFPGKAESEPQREAEWREEMREVSESHLQILSDFVSGAVDMDKDQGTLWAQYAFDAIPLEFISSIYEVFTTSRGPKSGVVYTPSHLVDLILDSVLPWTSETWDLKVLDPACGSGIFLVKAFQRLVHRWRNANPHQEPRAATLRHILEKNLHGVDLDPHAVRVASFSLYLAMCDEIDPKHYWRAVRFPRLRDVTLIAQDFFDESVVGIRCTEDAESYDLIIGNAPWGKHTATDHAKKWAESRSWKLANFGIGALFLPKAVELIRNDGRVSMIQSAGSILFNRESTALEQRKRLFADFHVEEIVNLSALRFGLFNKAVSPACIVTILGTTGQADSITYICPKPNRSAEDDNRIFIDNADVSEVSALEAQDDPTIWTALMWGSRRDYYLVKKLQALPTIWKWTLAEKIKSSEGIIWGNEKENTELLGKPLLEAYGLDRLSGFVLETSSLPKNSRTGTERPRDETAFYAPQLLIKQSWSTRLGRFRAAMPDSPSEGFAVLCTQSFVSVHGDGKYEAELKRACKIYNSRFAVYMLLLTSGRLATYRPEPLVEELLAVPIPPKLTTRFPKTDDVASLDQEVFESLGLNEAEIALIKDLIEFTLPDFKGGADSPGRRSNYVGDFPDQLSRYVDAFGKVIKAAIGKDRCVRSTIYTYPAQRRSLCRVAFELDAPDDTTIVVGTQGGMDGVGLGSNDMAVSEPSRDFVYRRVMRSYEIVDQLPRITIIKPNQVRFWTRSAAMRDADEVFRDVAMWSHSTR